MTLTAVLLLTVAGSVSGAKVYKWVDQDGNVHFGDRPNTDGAQEMEIKTREPVTPAPVAPRLQGNTLRSNISDVMEEERLRRKEAREKEKEARDSRQRNCLLARDRLRSYEESNCTT